ncbi:MAG: hypothetical protein ACR2OU_04185 [Thermomicrobiales bacterium]
MTDVGTITVLDLETRSTRRLLFYARPEDHAARNMFEIGVLALSRAIEEGHFDARWEFYGIGKIESATSITLARGHQLHLLPRQSQDTYKELLRAHDLGLGLMDTPHPSLVPLEMASAGMVVVTNTFETKTEAALRDISSNIIAVEPTIETIARGLADAARRLDDYVGRAHGSHVKWSRSSDCSFDGAFLTRLRAFTEGTP